MGSPAPGPTSPEYGELKSRLAAALETIEEQNRQHDADNEMLSMYNNAIRLSTRLVSYSGLVSFFKKLLLQLEKLSFATHGFLLVRDPLSEKETRWELMAQIHSAAEGITSAELQDGLAAHLFAQDVDHRFSVGVEAFEGAPRAGKCRGHTLRPDTKNFSGVTLSSGEKKFLELARSKVYSLVSISPKVQDGTTSGLAAKNNNTPVAVIGLAGTIKGKSDHDIEYMKVCARVLFPAIYHRILQSHWFQFSRAILNNHHSNTKHHAKKVTKYADAAAKRMNLDSNVLDEIEICGQLHDIGKLYTPLSILWRPYHQNSEEFEVITRHPAEGFNLLRNLPTHILGADLSGLYFHHRESNGKGGYPNRKQFLNDLENRKKAIKEELSRLDGDNPAEKDEFAKKKEV
jgi:HD-GYP domain-containing protein (c-di-GMP phosphodiesterase class II)